MNGDKKTGLALGVLLVGIVGAFFFRNESSPLDAPIPQLENPGRLDAQIAEKRRIPYLTGVETDDPLSDAPPFTPTAAADPADERTAAPFDPAFDAGAFDTPFVDAAPAPDPIRAPAANRSGGFSHNSAWEVVGTASPPTQPVAATAVSEQFHEVTSGDTLSGLAYQYLGSSARYHEIFQANRDVLKSPNDLRIGMKLRIPPRDGSRSAAGAAFPSATEPRNQIPARTINSAEGPTARNASGREKVEVLPASPPAVAPTAPPDGRLFRPVPRQPFLPGRSTSRDIPVRPVKTLSQQPPANLPSPDESAWSQPAAAREPTIAPFRRSASAKAERSPERPVSRLADLLDDVSPFESDAE